MKEKIAKLLNLTQSSNDAEALVAIRKANKLLQAKNKTWEMLLNSSPEKIIIQDVQKTTTTVKPENTQRPTKTEFETYSGKEVEDLFENLAGDPFAEVLLKYYQKKGYLTVNQFNSLKRKL